MLSNQDIKDILSVKSYYDFDRNKLKILERASIPELRILVNSYWKSNNIPRTNPTNKDSVDNLSKRYQLNLIFEDNNAELRENNIDLCIGNVGNIDNIRTRPINDHDRLMQFLHDNDNDEDEEFDEDEDELERFLDEEDDEDEDEDDLERFLDNADDEVHAVPIVHTVPILPINSNTGIQIPTVPMVPTVPKIQISKSKDNFEDNVYGCKNNYTYDIFVELFSNYQQNTNVGFILQIIRVYAERLFYLNYIRSTRYKFLCEAKYPQYVSGTLTTYYNNQSETYKNEMQNYYYKNIARKIQCCYEHLENTRISKPGILNNAMMQIIAKYTETYQDLLNMTKINHKFKELINIYHYNAVPIDNRTIADEYDSVQTLYFNPYKDFPKFH